MKRRYTISSLEHMIRLINQYPQLLALSSFIQINQVGNQIKNAVARSKCNCSAGPIYAQNRSVFETALNNLQYGDHLLVKNILGVEELCFYIKDSAGTFKLKCV